MKAIQLYIFTAIFIATAMLSAFVTGCSKERKTVATVQTDFKNKARVQVFSAALSSNRNYVYVDGNPVTGATFVYSGSFPTSGNSFAVNPGVRSFTIKDTLASSVQTPMIFSENFEPGKFYTIFTYDTINAIKHITVPTTITVPSDTSARVRFANMVYSKSATPAVDIFSVKRNANVFTNVSTTQVTDFIPYASILSDTLVVRQTGSTTVNLDTLRGFAPTGKRSYTLVYIGRNSTNEAGGAALPRTLVSFINN